MTSPTSKRKKFVTYLHERVHNSEWTIIDADDVDDQLDKLELLVSNMNNSKDANIKKAGKNGFNRIVKLVDKLQGHYFYINQLLYK